MHQRLSHRKPISLENNMKKGLYQEMNEKRSIISYEV